jgi:hypothetical protein
VTGATTADCELLVGVVAKEEEKENEVPVPVPLLPGAALVPNAVPPEAPVPPADGAAENPPKLKPPLGAGADAPKLNAISKIQ